MWYVIKQHLNEIMVWLFLAVVNKIVRDNLPDFHYKVVIRKIKTSLQYVKAFIVSLPTLYAVWQMKRVYDKLDTQTQAKVLLLFAIFAVCALLASSDKSRELKAEQ